MELIEKLKVCREFVNKIQQEPAVNLFLNEIRIYFRYEEDDKFVAVTSPMKVGDNKSKNFIGITLNIYKMSQYDEDGLKGLILHEIGHNIVDKNIRCRDIFDKVNLLEDDRRKREKYEIEEILADSAGAVLEEKIFGKKEKGEKSLILKAIEQSKDKDKEYGAFSKRRIENLEKQTLFYLFK